MRTFLINFVYNSAGQYNADHVLFKHASFPTSHEINKKIQSIISERGLQVYGAILWTGITEITEADETQFTYVEE